MTNDFIIVTRHPTPDELLARLYELAPDFHAFWETSLLMLDDDTVHGVFSEFSYFMREHINDLNHETRTAIFDFIEQCILTDIHSDSGVSNAACTCFLENFVGEGELSQIISGYLGPESRKYFDKWNE
jgi:hypothetical protein